MNTSPWMPRSFFRLITTTSDRPTSCFEWKIAERVISLGFCLLAGVVNCAWFPPHTPFVVVKKNVVTVCAASCHSNAIPSLENNWIAWLPTRALAEYFQPATARIMEAAKCHCYRPGRCNFNEPFSDALIRLGQSGKRRPSQQQVLHIPMNQYEQRISRLMKNRWEFTRLLYSTFDGLPQVCPRHYFHPKILP